MALVRRFAEAAFFAREFGSVEAPRNHGEVGPLAVLAMNGDDIGGWLRGEESPAVRDVLHPDLRDYFAALRGTAAGLAAPRPMGPPQQVAISQALANFALHIAPAIIAKHSGTLIYCGGDDLLVLLPGSTAVACAHELRLAYSGDPRVNGGARSGYYRAVHGNGHDLLTMGHRATAAAGLAVVNSAGELQFALAAARKAVQAAKDAGGNLLQLVAYRRRGEHSAVICPWEFSDTMQKLVAAFSAGASDRWICRLSAELPTLKALDRDAVLAEMRRQTGQADETTRGRLPPDEVVAVFDAYCHVEQASRLPENSRPDACSTSPLEDFVTLCQTASLLAPRSGL
jgi:CRISPR-associated protein Cmr2